MATVEKINELDKPYWARTRCKANVGLTTQRWRYHAGEPPQCKRCALYTVNGTPLCELHAGKRLIEIELDKNKK